MSDQEKVRAFIADHDLGGDASTWVHDLQSELGEVSKEVLEATDYGSRDPEFDDTVRDEIGDLYFSLLGLAATLDIDLSAALDDALAKYADR
ncbi:MAG: MazG nucleotide pyrophosphohydrolase domain-containing protein, partial [Candidatus Nanohaloarchaea archaeon]